MQSLPPRHLCTSRSSIDTDMALLADIFTCQPSISHYAIAILVDCWSTCWSICRSTPDQVSANMWSTVGQHVDQYVDQHLTKCRPTCVLKLGQGSWVSVLRIRYRSRRFENSFCSVVRVIPRQPHWVSLSDFCRGSTHFFMLHCPWIPLKCDAIAVPIFSKKQKIISN